MVSAPYFVRISETIDPFQRVQVTKVTKENAIYVETFDSRNAKQHM